MSEQSTDKTALVVEHLREAVKCESDYNPFGNYINAASAAADLIEAQAARIIELEAERDAYRRAKAENDERFMRERDEARAERDAWLGMYKTAAERALGFASMVRDAGLPVRDGLDGTALAAHDRQIAERAWREGYYTGKRDYAGSITGGMPISTPNPYSSPEFGIGSVRREDAI